MQRAINFEDVGVILVNDGEGNEIPSECFREYPFEVRQFSIPHGGISKARNTGLDASNADWVMFCDFDDGFSSVFGLHMIFSVINDNSADTLWSNFTEETKDKNGNTVLVEHDHDWVYIHGKAHRRQYLIDNEIRFHEKLQIHEDVYFTVLAQTLAEPDRIAAIKVPIYVWKWNDESITRKNPDEDFTFATYDHVIRQRIALTEEFLRREQYEFAITIVVKTIVDAYYDCQQFTWRDPENAELMRKAEGWISAYLKRYAGYYARASAELIRDLMSASRKNTVEKRTFLVEQETMMEWFDRIINDAKPIPEEQIGV